MNTLIKLIEQQQIQYSKQKDKEYLKNNSQFFTPYNIALKMIHAIDINNYINKKTLYILEPSAGFGMLIASLIIFIIKNDKKNSIKTIYVDAYETENKISKTLDSNLKLIKHTLKENYNISFNYNIIKNNFITSNKRIWTSNKKYKQYDIIISNPPFDKINQTSSESIVMNDIVHGQPNLYTLFIAMSLKLLNNNGVYVVLSPRNYLNGTYSTKLREFIFKNYNLKYLHSFEKRTIFNFVFQEVIISSYVRKNDTNINKDITISYNGHHSFKTSLNNIISNKDNLSIILPKTKEELLIFNHSNFKYKLEDINLKISVGPVVQFRENYVSKNIFSENSNPLLVNIDILDNNKIDYYKRINSRKTHNKSISKNSKRLIDNSNYVIIRKITAKNNCNLLLAAVLHEDFFNTDKIGLDNNLVYIHKLDNSKMSIKECYGIYCYISSSYFKKIYSLINGTHTINISDFNNIKFPSKEVLLKLGDELLATGNYTEKECDNVLAKYI
ncbi:Eco57I restriction-modification methylase domain-containing protein [Clostridium cochlearium]|uniref:Eco57I restriction-modification methylase domain-containing protein n=1 Tax=Clostridium cochlearium TaxID=1494 RepID=UPI001C0EA543|nr:Eco57I restriction-modification methylase domain-containing protein [Clostridium cochlearium]MBU5269441.1 Eco57I restriction-modification methylase domain-containing protein [Clostridium cochlearium]